MVKKWLYLCSMLWAMTAERLLSLHLESRMMIVHLAIEAEPDLCAWLVTEFARRRDNLAAHGEDFASYSFDDCITSVLWDAYERAEGRDPELTAMGSETRASYTVTPDMADAHERDGGP